MKAHQLLAGAVIIALIPSTAHAADTPRPDCPEYTTNRVLFGELQTIACDVSPPQHLDLIMFPRRLDGHSPKYRCEHMGGHYTPSKKKCWDIDY